MLSKILDRLSKYTKKDKHNNVKPLDLPEAMRTAHDALMLTDTAKVLEHNQKILKGHGEMYGLFPKNYKEEETIINFGEMNTSKKPNSSLLTNILLAGLMFLTGGGTALLATNLFSPDKLSKIINYSLDIEDPITEEN